QSRGRRRGASRGAGVKRNEIQPCSNFGIHPPDMNVTSSLLAAFGNSDGIGPGTLALWVIAGVVLLVFFVLMFNFFFIWLRALSAGARVTFLELIALRLRGVPVGLIVDTRITAVKSGLDVSIDDLSTHYLAGGNVEMVILALIAARKAGIKLDYDKACAIDLATNTAFEILSIDIADVNVGENVGAKLQAEQAEANKLIAQAHAEVRRAAAVALEQEMLARVQEMRARVVEAEAQVPLAMAEAFRSGNLGVMDYYRMKNIQADTG